MVQNFTKMAPNLSEELFAVYIFAEQTCNTWTTPLAVDCHAPHTNLVTQRKDEAKKQFKHVQQRSVPFVWSPSRLRMVSDCHRGQANWLVKQKESSLISTSNSFRASLTAVAVSYMVAGGFSSTAAI